MYRKVKLNIPDLKDEYTIDTLGCVYNESKGYYLKGTSITKNNRYVKIHINKFYTLHRLVALHFLPNPDNLPQVNHIDGNRLNNSVSNLEWCSQRDNIRHAYKTNLKSNVGENNPTSKLSKNDVIRIWALRNSPLSARQIRDKLKLSVSIDAIKAVRSGKNWSHITSRLV